MSAAGNPRMVAASNLEASGGGLANLPSSVRDGAAQYSGPSCGSDMNYFHCRH